MTDVSQAIPALEADWAPCFGPVLRRAPLSRPASARTA